MVQSRNNCPKRGQTRGKYDHDVSTIFCRHQRNCATLLLLDENVDLYFILQS